MLENKGSLIWSFLNIEFVLYNASVKIYGLL